MLKIYFGILTKDIETITENMNRKRIYYNDLISNINKIDNYTHDFTYKKFCGDELVQDAVLRNLELICHELQQTSLHFDNKYIDIDSQKIKSYNDIIERDYEGIELKFIWDIIKNKLPLMRLKVKDMV